MAPFELPTVSSIDDLIKLAVQYAPAALLVALAGLSAVLILKDVWNGFRKPFLKPDSWQKLPLAEIRTLTHNTKLFRFALPHPDQQLGLPVGQHISLRGSLPDGEEVMRAYTPISDINQRGFVDFVIKLYPDGKMSRVLSAMKVGDTIDVKGPKGRFRYQPHTKRAIGMVAGGSGITPMYQVAQAILKDPHDTTQLSLIFGNVAEEDILMRDELDALADRYPNFKVFHVLNNPPKKGWKGGSGFITQAMIKEHLPPPGDNVIILRCGPSPMNKAMEAHLDALAYSQDMQFQF